MSTNNNAIKSTEIEKKRYVCGMPAPADRGYYALLFLLLEELSEAVARYSSQSLFGFFFFHFALKDLLTI